MRTRYLLCLLSLLGLISACSSGSGSKQHQTQQAHYESIQTADTTLVGKRVYLEFDSNSSVVEYLSSRHLFWSSRDSVHGYKEGEDNYHAVRIGLHVFFSTSSGPPSLLMKPKVGFSFLSTFPSPLSHAEHLPHRRAKYHGASP